MPEFVSWKAVSEMPVWTIYVEGYRITGNDGQASLVGTASGETFIEACRAYARSNPEFASQYDPVRNTHWGCQLFPTLAAAQKSFG